MDNFIEITKELLMLIEEWESKLRALSPDIIKEHRNAQNRSTKQIIGHMVDSATNNTHRIVHLQYQESPLHYPNYATHGNNDRWIAIQHYLQEDWSILVNLWKYSNLHIAHVIQNVDSSKLENQWKYSEDRFISLKEGIVDYLRHFKLHLGEINELLAISD